MSTNAIKKLLITSILASWLGLSLEAQTKTDTFAQLIAESPQSLLGVTKLIVTGIPGINELTIINPIANADTGRLEKGTGSVRWNKWGALRVKDADVKEEEGSRFLELAVVGMLPTKNFILNKGSSDAVEVEFSLRIGANGVKTTGFSVTVPEGKLPGGQVTVKDLTVRYTPPEIYMEGLLQFGTGKALGGGFSIIEGQFNGLKVAGSDLNIRLGSTPSKIDKLDVGFFGMNASPQSIYIEGGFTILVGETRVANRWPFEVEARGKLALDNWRVDIRGTALIAGIPVGGAYLTYIPSFNIDAGAYIDLLSIIMGNATIQARGGSIGGSIAATVQVPYYVPLIGNWRLGGANAAFLFAPPNWEAAGNVYVNVIPAIPSWCTPRWCPPCIPYCYPRGWSWVNARWCPPCIPPICTPRIPAVALNFGFKVRNSSFSFTRSNWDGVGELYDDVNYVQYPDPNLDVWSASSWEKPWRPVAYDPEGLYEIVWLTNFRQIGKVSTTPTDPLTQEMTVVPVSNPAQGNAKGGPLRFLSSGKVLVPEGAPEVGVRMHWGTEDVFSEKDLAFTITLPSGKNIQLEDKTTLAELEKQGLTVLVDFNSEDRSAWVFSSMHPRATTRSPLSLLANSQN